MFRKVILTLSALNFVFAASGFSDSRFAAATPVASEKALEVAIAYAKANSPESYGGELTIEEAASVLKTENELLVLDLLVSKLLGSDLKHQPIGKIAEQDPTWVSWLHSRYHVVVIKHQGCYTATHFIGVSKTTGQPVYLFVIEADHLGRDLPEASSC